MFVAKGEYGAWFWIWILAKGVSTLYKLTWDYLIDWGLCRPNRARG